MLATVPDRRQYRRNLQCNATYMATTISLLLSGSPEMGIRDAESSGESRQPQFQWHNRAAPRTIR
jgi:hypothetical protein